MCVGGWVVVVMVVGYLCRGVVVSLVAGGRGRAGVGMLNAL